MENIIKNSSEKKERRICVQNLFDKKSSSRLLILLYGLLGCHMAAGIKSVGRRTGVNVKSRLNAHAKRHHWAQL